MTNKTRPEVAERTHNIHAFQVMELLARAKQLEAAGRDIIHMEVGEPDFATPEPIVEAGVRALRSGKTRYTSALGIPELRQAIAAHYKSSFGVEVSAQRIIVTPGASGALQLALGAIVNAGDQVLMTDPGYPCNRHFVRLFGGHDCAIPVSAQSAYQLNLELVKSHWSEHAKAIMLASPSNPTGTLIPPESMREIVNFAQHHNAWVIADEIYQGLTYDQAPATALAISDQVIVVNSFSKYFQMTGWRLGWLVVPEDLVPVIDRMAQNLFLAAPSVAQYAALSAFETDTLTILEARRLEFKQRRDVLLAALTEIGFEVPVTPQGAFYIYANCASLTNDSDKFCKRLLEEVGVAVTPGLDFGNNQPESYIRFAYTNSMSRLKGGAERISTFLK